MSVRCISRVFDESVHSGTELVMLLALADYSDDHGISYPAVDALARKCRIKARWVQYVLRTLVASGELLILKNQGPHRTNKYQLIMKTKSDDERVHCGAGCTMVQGALQRPQMVHSDAALIEPNEPSERERAHAQQPARKRAPPRGVAVGLEYWIQKTKAAGEVLIPDSDPVFQYAREAGIPHEYLVLAWKEFRHAHQQQGAKKYIDWRAAFRKAIRANWYRLWRCDPNGNFVLTTQGTQAEHVARSAAP